MRPQPTYQGRAGRLSAIVLPQQSDDTHALVDDVVAEADGKGTKVELECHDFQSVWSQFNRRFYLAKYEELTLTHFEEALTWLKAWLDRSREQQ